MPIYAYRCETCGHAKDVLQRLSDPVLVVCPACGASTFRKQLTAAGFQLKGSGWYATDFKGAPKVPATDGGTEVKPASGDDAKSTEGKSTDGKPAEAKTDAVKPPASSPAPAASTPPPAASGT